jgi:hypothetical protein
LAAAAVVVVAVVGDVVVSFVAGDVVTVLVDLVMSAPPVFVPFLGAAGGAAWACSACWRACCTTAGSCFMKLSADLVLPTDETANPSPKASGPRMTSAVAKLRTRFERPCAERKRKRSGPRKKAKPMPWSTDE